MLRTLARIRILPPSQVLALRRQPPSAALARLDRVVMAALARDPKQRPAGVNQLISAVRRCLTRLRLDQRVAHGGPRRVPAFLRESADRLRARWFALPLTVPHRDLVSIPWQGTARGGEI